MEKEPISTMCFAYVQSKGMRIIMNYNQLRILLKFIRNTNIMGIKSVKH